MTTVDDTENFTIALAAEPAKGEIVDIDKPLDPVRAGDSVTIKITMKNIGGTAGGFHTELYEGTTKVASLGMGGVASGGTMTQVHTLAMPNHAWNLTAKVIRH